MFKKLINKIVGDPNVKYLDNLKPDVDAVAELEPAIERLSDQELKAKTVEFREGWMTVKFWKTSCPKRLLW